MKTILIKEGCPNPISLGEKGENGVGAVLFDYSEWLNDFGNGAISLLVKRKGDQSAYPVVLTTADGVATWTISDIDTAVQGYGKAEYIFTIDDKIAKSAVFSFFVAHDIGPNGDPPDPYESWIDTLTALGGETLINAQAAQAAQEAAETAQTAAETAATNAESSATAAAQSAGAARDMAASALQSADRSSEAADRSEQALEEFTTPTASAETLPEGSNATASYADGHFTFGIPRGATGATGPQGEKGDKGDKGDTGEVDASAIYPFLPTDSASGSIASFSDGADNVPVEALTVSLEPKQDLHGYDAPWPAGGGTNIVDQSALTHTGIINDNGTVQTVATRLFSDYIKVSADTAYYIAIDGKSSNNEDLVFNRVVYYDENKTFISRYDGVNTLKSATFTTLSNAAYMVLDIKTRALTTPLNVSDVTELTCAKGSSAVSWSPYENICPITGHTACEVWREATYDTSAQPQITIPLGQTVYGGVVDVVGGKCVVDRAMIDLGSLTWSKNTANGVFYAPFSGYATRGGGNYGYQYISSMFAYGANIQTLWNGEGDGLVVEPEAISSATRIYARVSAYTNMTESEFTTAVTGQTLVYELAQPITIDITDIPTISTLLGTNNIWSDSGDVDVTYRADIQRYIQKLIAEAIA